MKHFIYTYSENTRRGTTEKTVRIYQIKRGVPTFVASGTDTYVSEFQLVMQTMQVAKILPRKAFELNQFNGFKYCYSSMLAEAKIATVWRVS